MKAKYITFIGSLCCFVCLHAQSLAPQVVASAGNFISSASGSVSYTVGETVTPTLAGGGHIITQGFQQPTDIINGLLEIDKEAFGSFSVYPVPAVDKLWFGYEFPSQGLVKVELFDMMGQKLDFTFTESYDTGKSVHSLDCTKYAAASYVITATFTGSDNDAKTFSKKFLIIN